MLMKTSITYIMARRVMALCGILLCIGLTVSAQQKLYTVTGKSVNMRESPVTGKVIGKVSEGESFLVNEDKDGWIGLWHDKKHGYVSKQFVREVKTKDFSRRHLGDYMGNSAMYSDGYSLATLKERDGYVILNVTDYSDVNEFGGMRAQTSWTYVGLPDDNGVLFTHMPYPYHGDIPVKDQLTDHCKIDGDGDFLFVGEDGGLYTPLRSFGAQEETTAVSEPKLTERSLFMLRGDVKTMKIVRAYNIGEDDDAPLSDISYEYTFSPAGDLRSIVKRDVSGEKIGGYQFTQSGDRFHVKGIRPELDFTADYTRKISNYCISYSGEWELKGVTAGDYSGCLYNFDMNGRMPAQSFFEYAPPFMTNGDGEYDNMTYTYGDNPTSPTHINMDLQYGGDGWVFDAEIKGVKTDAQGNWTERKAYVDGELFFTERRFITYYGEPAANTPVVAGTATDNTVYTIAEQMPEYPGGMRELMTFIARNLRYPALCAENGIKGCVKLKFVVEQDGTIGRITTVSSPHPLLEKEAIRIVGLMPKWIPGKQNGKPVRVTYTLPVNFTLH